ncbi:MAG: VOC family protein [Alphaproteobacteria bacterium]|nr:VOC family protein [Alphaproteobacteria bacterium]
MHDRIDEAAQCFRALGFNLTPRGFHTLGSANHLAIFATDYLELLGFGAGGARRTELQSFPIGLNGLVFTTDNAERIYQNALAAGLPIQPVQSFSRPVTLAGTTRDARFRTTRLDSGQVPMGRVYFCEHLTPELVWRPEWQAHPNGVCAISRVVVATPEPRRTAALFHALFGSVTTARDDRLTFAAGTALIELASPAAVSEEFGDAAADADGRNEYLAAAEFRVTSLQETMRLLRQAVEPRVEDRRALVPATAAFNSALGFTE